MPDTAIPSSSDSNPLDWSKFNRDAYRKATFAACRALQTQADKFIPLCSKSPGVPLPGELSRAANSLHTSLEILSNPDGPSDEDERASKLAMFFPPGTRIPGDAVAPEDLVSGLFLPIFKAIYPTLRKIMMAYATPGFRENWHAFHPVFWQDEHFVAVEKIAYHQGEKFNARFADLPWMVQQIIGLLVTCCSAARRRMSEDVFFLEALFWALVVNNGIVPFFRRDFTPNLVDPELGAASLFNGFFAPLRPILITNPKTYKQHVRSEKEAGFSCAFTLVQGFLANFFATYRGDSGYWPKDSDDPEATSKDLIMNQFMDIYCDTVGTIGKYTEAWPDSAELQAEMKEERRGWKKAMVTQYVCPDTCDYCQTSIEETKLMRCSKCISARYCSRKCQKTAWKHGCVWRLTTARDSSFGRCRTRTFALMPRRWMSGR